MTDEHDSAPARPPTTRRRLARFAAVAFLAAAAVVVLTKVLDHGVREGGPVGTPTGFVFASSEQVGTIIATGAATAFNRGDTTAVLDKVELVDAPPELDLLDIRIAGPRRGSMPALDPFDRPDFKRDLHPVKGYRLAPDTTDDGGPGVALVAIMRTPTQPGGYYVDGFRITYHVGDTRYRTRIDNRFRVCAYAGKRRVVECSSTPPAGK